MKKIIILSLATLALSACSFLKEKPESFVSNENYFKTQAQCRSTVNGTYVALRQVFNAAYWTMTDATTDIIYMPSSSDVNAIMDISPARCNVSTNVWNPAYQMIMYANAAVEGITSSPIKDEEKAPLIAEAKVMRAFWYYQLTSLFGDVPFYFDNVTDSETMNRIAKYPRMDAVATRATLIEDLQSELTFDEEGKYTGALPHKRADQIGSGYAGWAMGQMLIAKMALWNAYKDPENADKWADTALAALKDLETEYGNLNAYPLEDLLWRTKNTPEVIFEIQHTYESGGLSYVSNIATNCMPSSKKDEATGVVKYDGIIIPELGTEAKVGTCCRPTLYFCGALQPNTGEDKRAPINMAWEYNGTKFNSTSVKPWMGPKFWCPYMQQTWDYNNYPIFRYADAVLMIAECYYLKADTEGFVKYLNMVRARAGLKDYVFVKWLKAFEALRDERARELFGEFQRKFDLVRWGEWYERVVEYTDWETLRMTVKPCHEYLPIPDKQVIYSGYNLDNKAYNEYGM